MPMKSEISENDGRLIEGIQKQSKEIIDEIEKCPSESLDKIKYWINQINLKDLSSQAIQFRATIIDTIHCYSKKKSNETNTNLIEDCLCNLLSNLDQLPNDKILAIVPYLKAYIKNCNADAEYELEKFIGKLAPSINRFSLFSDISKQIVLSYEKSKSNFNNTFKIQLMNIPGAELASEAAKLNLDPECKPYFSENVFSKEFINASSKEKIRRKKIKSRIIYFDDEGIGYDINAPYINLKQPKRLAERLEIELSPRMLLKEELRCLGKIHIEEEFILKNLQKQIAEKEFELFASEEEKAAKLHNEEAKQQARMRDIEESIRRTKNFREYLRNKQKKVSKAKKISKVLDPIVFFIQEQIVRSKQEAPFNNMCLLGLKLPSFESRQDVFLTDFLATINYYQFKELINFAESSLISIGKIKKTLNKITDFYKTLGLHAGNVVRYIDALDRSEEKIKENFNKDAIFNFLENSLNLFKQRTLNLDNNYCLLNIKEQKGKLEFAEPEFLRSFILKNSPERILEINSEHLNQFFSQNDDKTLYNKRALEPKDSILKLSFNFFSGKYLFLSQNHKRKFVKKFLLNFQKHPNFKLINNEISKLKWWHFVLMGVSPFYVFKKKFREFLSKKLFFDLIEAEFKNTDKEACIESIDALYSIQDRLKSSNISFESQSIPLSRLDVSRSRQEIIDRLNNHEEIKKVLKKSSSLVESAMRCVKEFSDLKSTYQRENKKTSSFFESNTYLFKNNSKKFFFPINTENKLSSSYPIRGIN